MRARGPASTREPIPRVLSVTFGVLLAVAVSTTFAVETGDQLTVAASLLFLGDVRERSGLATLVGWLLGGALIGAALGYGATAWIVGFPLATQGGVGLGIALGGGVGVVSNLMAADARDADDGTESAESMTVDMESDDSPSPRPADLFDGHPDPVLYVADQGHGPVVLAANEAFGATFDVPTAAISGTPLEEALMATEDAATSTEHADVVDASTTDVQADVVLECQTPQAVTEFRLRTVGGGADGYVLYTAL